MSQPTNLLLLDPINIRWRIGSYKHIFCVPLFFKLMFILRFHCLGICKVHHIFFEELMHTFHTALTSAFNEFCFDSFRWFLFESFDVETSHIVLPLTFCPGHLQPDSFNHQLWSESMFAPGRLSTSITLEACLESKIIILQQNHAKWV